MVSVGYIGDSSPGHMSLEAERIYNTEELPLSCARRSENEQNPRLRVIDVAVANDDLFGPTSAVRVGDTFIFREGRSEGVKRRELFVN